MNYKVYLSPPSESKNDVNYTREAVSNDKESPKGKFLVKLEKYCEKFFLNSKIKGCYAVNSGTSALHIALKLLDVKKNDVILCQSSTFIATVNPILYQKAIPVFIDCEKISWNICPILLEKSIKDFFIQNLKPKAIIIVCSYGMPCNYNEILRISNKYNIPLIEDSAAAFGSRYGGVPCGAFGEISVFSFNTNKIITGYSGGVLSCQNDIFRERIANLISQGKSGHEIGHNYRMSNVTAAIVSSQFQELEGRVVRKRQIFNKYRDQLSDFKEVSFQEELDGSFSNRWMTTILFETEELRNSIEKDLRENKIETREIWEPLHLMKRFGAMKAYSNGVSEELFFKGLCLPSGLALTESEQNLIIRIIRSNLSIFGCN